jgi:hypothetical protein
VRTDDTDFADAPGQDSFLDVVANMVGIMILLVMVVGLRASREVSGVSDELAATAAVAKPEPVSEEQVQAAFHEAADLEREVRELVHRAVNLHSETELREQERNWLTTFVTAAEQELDERRGQLDSEQQRDFDMRRKLTEAQLTLDNLAREQVSLLTEPTEVEEIESLPTPLAKTVSGKEIHLRLAEGHVAVIPLDELLDELKQHAERNLWRLRDQNSVEGTIGPAGGFRLRYLREKRSYVVRNEEQVQATGAYVQFTKWELLPTSSQIGEPVEQALLPRSDLWYALKKNPPETTTVTIWTYPGSFNEFRRLKEVLFEAGYATAGRPLPDGILIGGSPHGSKSAAQ